ncbi:MAG: ferritin-like domain-containing protein [Gemmatimonadaceae bacterium]|nr:ferritin-like domain-containing protein [Gemmatimonadaceae bacterium]
MSAVVADRREFLRRAGLAGAALALVGCGAGAPELLAPSSGPRGAVVGAGGAITLDFSQDIDVLNYAYALEQLEAAFYIGVVTNGAFASVFTAAERRVLTDIRDHEVAHRDFFAAALGSARIPDLTPKFGAIDFADRTSVLQTARTFEDLGVSAYNGAARFIASEAYLGVAGKIVSVEARHASAIRDMLSPRSAAFAPDAFDAGSTPQDVLTAAGPFITESITVVNA